MKGTTSEAELHLIRARLQGGLRNKASRGELQLVLPVSLDRADDGQITLTADEQVRHAIGRLVRLQPDHRIAAILNKQGRRTGIGLPFTESRVAGVRERARIPVAPPPDPASELHIVEAAARELGVAQTTI